ncbi:minor tail protein [Staphylococcus phage S-CoN_Ph14]|nr:minor tail protein [Staphylococcus phage S-CoN_Ph14]
MASEEIKKTAVINMYDSPYVKATHDSGVVFYNLDIATAVLEFHIKKDNFPLQISDKNVDTYVYLKGTDRNGNPYGRQLDVEYIDPFNGIVSLTVPNDYLQTVNNSTVTGQMYISLHRDNRVPETKSDTAVLNEFKFKVRDSLINSISGVTKIEYIRMFDKLRDEIQKRISDIEEAIANGEDYVAEMKTVLSDGTKLIKDTADKAVDTVNTTSDNAINTVNTTKDLAVNTITSARDEVLNAINDNEVVRKTEMSGYFDEQDWQKYKLTNDDGTSFYDSDMRIDFDNNEQLDSLHCDTRYVINSKGLPSNIPSNSGWLTKYSRQDGNSTLLIFKPYNSSYLYTKEKSYNTWGDWKILNPNYEKDLNWQKYKFTEDDGTIKYISKGSITDVKTLPPGFYETVSNDDASSQDIPLDNSYVQIKVWEANEGRKEIELTSTYNNKKYFRLLHTNGDRDSGWIEVGPTQEDTGWIPFQLLNGAQSNTEYSDSLGNGFKCSYRTVVNGSLVTNYLRINGRNIQTDTVIAKIPEKMVKHAQTFIPRTPTNRPMGYIILYTNGEVKFFVNGGTGTASWDSSAYMYGEFSWTN